MQLQKAEDSVLSQKLKQFRRIKHLSQEELSVRSGISVRTIQRLENGDSVGSAYTLKKLADAIEIEPSQLTGSPASVDVDLIASRLLNRVNLGALCVLLLPLLNIIIPLVIFWAQPYRSRNKNGCRPDHQFPGLVDSL